MGLEYTFTPKSPTSSSFHISSDSTKDQFVIFDSGLLNEKKIEASWKRRITEDIQLLLASKDDHWASFDLLGIAFFLISRYEEYVEPARDQHDRFMAISSCLFHANCLEIPLVDKIIYYLKNQLERKLSIKCHVQPSRLISTIDVDFPWYRKNLKFPFYLRKKKLGNENDPYDTFQSILRTHKNIGVKPIFFFLVGGSPPYEKINRYNQEAYAALIKQMAQSSLVGIHPPYGSGSDLKAMQHGIQKFEKLSSKSPIASRQHYLRLILPTTYRLLLTNNIQADYSMGFADRVGFRAGTARSFFWYDLIKESKTELRIIPLIAMDVTLKNYMGLTARQGLDKLLKLQQIIIKYGGNMSILWHNSSLSEMDDWSEYKKSYFDFLASFKNSKVD